jgi:hypothetical protein
LNKADYVKFTGVTGGTNNIFNKIKAVASPTSPVGKAAAAIGGGPNSRYSTKILTYPFNVVEDNHQGHYIMFSVKELDKKAQLKQQKARKSFAAIARNLEQELNYDQAVLEYGNLDSSGPLNNESYFEKQAIAGAFRTASNLSGDTASGGNRSIQLALRPTVRTGTTISLYMPPQIQVQYQVKFAEEKIGSLAQLGMQAIEAFRGGSSVKASLTNLRDAAGGNVREGLTSILNSTLDTLAPGARALQQIDSGKVITPRMEMMFEGVGRRSFSFTFDFLPKSEAEAKTVEQIIYTFKENMMPSYTNATTRREMEIPNTFDIEYKYQATENGFINKISECFLTTVDVQYGGDRFTAHERSTTGKGDTGAPPQKSKITLSFTELETLSKEKIEQGF